MFDHTLEEFSILVINANISTGTELIEFTQILLQDHTVGKVTKSKKVGSAVDFCNNIMSGNRFFILYIFSKAHNIRDMNYGIITL